MDFKQIRKQDSQYAGGSYAEKRAQDCGQGTFVRAVYKKDDNGSENSVMAMPVQTGEQPSDSREQEPSISLIW